MATATGWGALPISLSFGDSIKSLVAELNGPVAKAAKNAGGSIEKEIGNASKKAADQYEKQQWRMEKATKEKTAAEENHRLKLLEQQRAQTALENAEKDLADAREAGGKKARDAQLRYEAAQIKVEKATIATRKASDKLDGSIDEIAKATESAEQAFKDMEKAQEDSNKESSKMGGMFDDMSGKAGKLGGALKDVVGKVGPLAAGIAGAASIGEVISLGQEAASSIGGLNRELGLTGDEARVMGDEVGEVLRSGVVGSAEEAAEAVGALKSNFKDLSDEDLSELADNFAGFSKTFDIDIAEATQTAGQLMTNGLAGDAEEAADLMTAAMQRMPKAMRDELPELTNEYGTFFSSLGYSGEDMMGMFVNVSDQGKIAMDKLGDSLKEAGIRATDLGDSGAVEALEEIGLGAEDIQNRLLAGGDTAKEAFQEMVGAIESVEDPAERAEAAVALIGTPLEDLNKAELDGFLGALSGGADAMEGFEGSSQELSDSIANSLQGRIDSLKGTVQDLAGDGFMFAWDTVSNVTGWMSGAWSDLSSTVADSEIAGKIKDTFTDVKDFAGDVVGILFNGDFDGMPFGIEEDSPIVDFLFNLRDTALDLKDRLGDIWQGIQDGIGTAIEYLQPFTDWVKDMLGDSFGDLWDSVKNIVDALIDIGKALAGGTIDLLKGFWEYAKGLWDVLSPFLVPILKVLAGIIGGALLAAIGLVVGAFRVITGVVEVFTEVVGWIAENVLAPLISKFGEVAGAVYGTIGAALSWLRDHWRDVVNAIVDGWNAFWGFIGDAWTTAKQNVFDAIVNTLISVRDWWNSVVDNLKLAWQVFSGVLQSVWATIRDAVVNAFISAWDNLRANFDNVMGLIGDAWQWLKDTLWAGYDWIRVNVFDKFKSSLDTIQGWFQAGVDGIGRIWDGLKAAAAKPVKFVVDTVWNNGILAAWNSIADFLPGIDTKEAIPLGNLGAYATGGVLPGWSPGRDIHEFVSPTGGRIHLSGGEAIMRPEWTRAVGGPAAVEQMNRAARSGNLDESQIRIGRAHGFLGGFASGGVIGAMAEIVRQKYGNILQLTSDYRPGHGPYHGTGQATDWSNGHGNTPEQLALAHDIAKTYPGSAELIYDSPGWAGNIKHGNNVGAFGQYYTMAQAGPHHHHVHWAMTTPPTMPFGGGVFEGGSNGGGIGAAVFNWIADRARGLWSKLVEPIKDSISAKMADFGDTAFAKIPGEMFSSLKDAAWSKISSLFGSGGGSSTGSVDVSDISGPIVDQVEMVFARHGFTGAEWDAAKWIIQKESNWNPNAVNPSSGAYGLFQFNPMGGNTLAAYLPDRNPDPAVQADAGARYMKDRYGTPTAAKAWWEQHQWYADGGVIDLPKLFDTGGVWRDGTMGVNLSGSDEVVFNNRQWQLLKQVLNTVPMLTDSQEMMVKEIGAAFLGGDVGYAELANALGSEKLAQQVTDIAFLLGEVSRDTEVMAAAAEFNDQARKSAEDYAAEQASGLLSTFGLEGLVPLAQKAGGMAWDAHVANPVDVAMTPNGITAYARKQGVHAEFNRGGATVTIEAESDDDLIRVKQFKKLAEQVDGLEVQVKRKPKAAVRTRGGVM